MASHVFLRSNMRPGISVYMRRGGRRGREEREGGERGRRGREEREGGEGGREGGKEGGRKE